MRRLVASLEVVYNTGSQISDGCDACNAHPSGQHSARSVDVLIVAYPRPTTQYSNPVAALARGAFRVPEAWQ